MTAPSAPSMIEPFPPPPSWTSDSPYLVPDFARRLAAALDLPFSDVLRKKGARPQQKTMENSDRGRPVMNDAPSLTTRAILLLTAPLIFGRERQSSPKPLAAGEYNRLARRLRELGRQPADLLGDGARTLLEECRLDLDAERLDRLLDRGFLLAQAMEHWRTRALWVTSRADAEYPQRLKRRLREQSPPVLYGCGNREDLDTGGLAVVGSRNVDDALITYTEGVGRLAAGARRAVVSGGARGIDQAAMRGALDAGGTVACVLADGLERAALRREHRGALMDGRLVLICPYDPAARFLVGHAMQRNKLIYALADAALVVSAEFEKGGTWAGAVEQLDRHRFISVYVRATGDMGRGLDALLERGARRWLNPDDPEALGALLDTPPPRSSSNAGSRLPAPRGSERSGSGGRRPASRGGDTDASHRTWFRGRTQSGRGAACKRERTATAVPGRAQNRGGCRQSV